MIQAKQMSVGFYMYEALKQAEMARRAGEIPVGAIVVHQNRIITQAQNRCERDHDATAHAEILALRQAGALLKDWRLCECTLYVTLEPCCMCAGAIGSARLKRLVFGAFDAEFGGCGSAVDLCNCVSTWRTAIVGGVMESECASMIRSYFERRRKEGRRIDKKTN